MLALHCITRPHCTPAAALPVPAFVRAGGKGAYGALECVGGDITGKVVEVRALPLPCCRVQPAAGSSVAGMAQYTACVRIGHGWARPHALPRHLPAVQCTALSAAQQQRQQQQLAPKSAGPAIIGGLPSPPPNQATRDDGTVLIYGAMAAFDFKCPIPPLLFRWGCASGVAACCAATSDAAAVAARWFSLQVLAIGNPGIVCTPCVCRGIKLHGFWLAPFLGSREC